MTTTETTDKQVRQSAIRWRGLAAFLIICGLLFAFSWLLLDSIIKWTLESTVGRLNGAEVNIERVEHGWMPLTLAVEGVQVTDPNLPEQNRVVVGELRGELDFGQLLIGRFIFEQLNVAGVRVNQAREAPGEVYQQVDDAAQQGLSDAWRAIQMELPSVDEIVSQVDLKTETILDEAKTVFSEQRERVQSVRDSLPSEEVLADYEAQVKAIIDGDVDGLAGIAEKRQRLEELKKRFEDDRQAVRDFKDVVVTAKDELQTQLQAVKDAPENDLQRIQEFFSMDSAGLENVTALIFGEQIRQWSKYVLLAYEQLGPMLQRSADETAQEPQRGEGVWFTFTEEDAPPEFLIKNAVTEFALGDTTIDVDWQNITHQHQQLGQPTTFQARGDNTNLWEAFNLNGELSMSASGIDARQQWQLRGAKLDDIALSERNEFAATLLATLLDSEGNVAVRNNQLDGSATVRLAELDIEASGEDRWAQLLANALGQLQRLDIRAGLSGDLRAPQLSLNSDLDRQIGQALEQTARDAAGEKLASLRADLQSQVDAFVQEQAPELNGMLDLESLADSRDARLDDLLKAKVEDELKDRLKDGLLERLGGND